MAGARATYAPVIQNRPRKQNRGARSASEELSLASASGSTFNCCSLVLPLQLRSGSRQADRPRTGRTTDDPLDAVGVGVLAQPFLGGIVDVLDFAGLRLDPALLGTQPDEQVVGIELVEALALLPVGIHKRAQDELAFRGVDGLVFGLRAADERTIFVDQHVGGEEALLVVL